MTPLSVPSSSSLPTQSRKRPNSLTINTLSPAKVRLKSPQTPDQPTIPKDPTFTSDSIESSDEDNTKHMIVTFVRTIMLHLPDLTEISWPSTAKRCKLSMSGCLNISETLLIISQERLQFGLGKRLKPIVAINDGAIIIEHYPSARHHAPWGIPRDRRVIQSVVSIEVHPLQSQQSNPQAKRRREKGEQADWRHAGQIFSEMLGQLCHPELYSLPTTEYLEVLPSSLLSG